MKIEIEVLGTGCRRCEQLYETYGGGDIPIGLSA